MEIINIEAGTFREMVMSIQLLKEKLENLKGNQTSKSLMLSSGTRTMCQPVITTVR